ncbi:MAG: stage II sporulation protein M [Candidatus Caldarchaeales archaeon]
MWAVERLKWAAATTAVLYAVFVAAAHVPLSREEARRMSEELSSIATSINSPLMIFANNAAIALLMVVPLLGAAAGLYVIYNTGLYLSALAITSGAPPTLLAVVPLLAIYGVLEFFGYGICFSEGLRLLRAITRRKLRPEIRPTSLMVAMGLLVLFVAALLEFLIIQSLQTFSTWFS